MTPLVEQPQYVAATKEITELQSALSKVSGRIVEIEALLCDRHTSDETKLDSQVVAALHFAETGIVRGPGDTPTALREEHLVLREQRDALNSVLKKHVDARFQLGREISTDVCRDLLGQHRALVKRYLDTLLQLESLQIEEEAFVREIESKGYEISFAERATWHHIGTLRMQSESALWHRVRDLKRYTGT
jgi:hypothetical protein